MKELLTFIKDNGIKPLLEILGSGVLVMFACTLIPSLSYIPKMFLLYILTPFIFGHN
jgi:hypothetical protein